VNSLLERLSISRRLTLISLAYTLPIAVLLYFVVNGINQDIRFSELEKLGNAYQRPLAKLLEHLPQHQLAARRLLAGDKDRSEALMSSQADIDQAFIALAAVDSALATTFNSLPQGWPHATDPRLPPRPCSENGPRSSRSPPRGRASTSTRRCLSGSF